MRVYTYRRLHEIPHPLGLISKARVLCSENSDGPENGGGGNRTYRGELSENASFGRGHPLCRLG